MVKIYTAQIRYSGPDRVDTTVKSGDKVFAPTWDMVMGHKNGTISDEEYIKKYVSLMRESLKKNKARWLEIMNMERVVLCCYCRKGNFCHRVLLAKMFEKNGAEYVGELDGY